MKKCGRYERMLRNTDTNSEQFVEKIVLNVFLFNF